MAPSADFQNLNLTGTRAKPTLETLPTELRILILNNTPNLKSLHNLVRASSACHQAYVCAREEILCGVVVREYAEDQVDVAEAIVAVRSRGVDASLESIREEIMTLLDYRRRPQKIRRLKSFKGSSPVEPVTVVECVDLLSLRRKFNFLVRDYCSTASRPPWVSEDKWNYVTSSLVSSDIEKARLLGPSTACRRTATSSELQNTLCSAPCGGTVPIRGMECGHYSLPQCHHGKSRKFVVSLPTSTRNLPFYFRKLSSKYTAQGPHI